MRFLKWVRRKPVEATLGGLALGAGIGLAFLAANWPETPQFGLDLIVLAGLSLLAEMWPVSIFRKSLRVTFTLPFLVGIVVVSGAVIAIAVDLLISLLSALAMMKSQSRSFSPLWLGVNLSVSAVSGTLAGLSWLLALVSPYQFGLLLPVGAFVATYGTANYCLIAAIDRLVHRHSIAESLLLHWRPNGATILLYVAAAILVGFMADSGLGLWSVITVIPIAVLRHSLRLQARYVDQYFDTVSALSMMLQRVHPYTLGHLRRVSRIAEEVSLNLGLSARKANLVKEAAILHDIGKIGINEAILDKPGRLTDEEFAHVKQHAAFGAKILEPAEAFAPMVRWIRHHHERPDGTGYPDQLSDMEIPVESKIIAVVDAFDAMTGGMEGKEHRVYRDPMTLAEALDELDRCSNSQFDPKVVAAFRQVVLGGSVT